MRKIILAVAAAGLCACQRERDNDDAAAAPKVEAALTFDGATAPDKAAQLAHGERLTRVLGCRGCHKPTLEGQWFNDDQPELGKIYASNLTRALPKFTDAQLETLLRDGTHPIRGELWIMPSEVFQRLSDADMKALIAHLRTVKPSGAPTPPPQLSARARDLVAKGEIKPIVAYVAKYRAKLPADLGKQYAFGRYIAGATCAECHGADLTGVPDFAPGIRTPDLDIAGTYSTAELERLLTTGEGKVRKNLGLMSEVGRTHFSYLTPRERAAVVAYVKARAERPQ